MRCRNPSLRHHIGVHHRHQLALQLRQGGIQVARFGMGVAAAGQIAAAQLCSELAQFKAIAVIQQPHREGWVVDGGATLQAAAHHLQRFTAAGQQQINSWESMQRLGFERRWRAKENHSGRKPLSSNISSQPSSSRLMAVALGLLTFSVEPRRQSR